MKYLLTLLSSGRPTYLERTLVAYAEFLTPAPSAVFVYDDGSTLPSYDVPWECPSTFAGSLGNRLGQCAAQAYCWQHAASSEYEFVFHVEDDSVLLRPTDLNELVKVLKAESHVCQMALVRCPWGAEIEHGGYIPKDPGWYERRYTTIYYPVGYEKNAEWISTTRNWAHSPALFRTDLCREFPFPAKPGCETTIGPMIRAKHPDAVFGLWGWGEPHCAHIGVERAPGSHGY